MKKQRQKFQKFRPLIDGRLILLAMMIVIGQGVGFSQAIKTVTTAADDGPGSLRQTIVEAVDGDVIDFDGAVTTITVESPLNLGDKTLTIDGKDGVIIQRNVMDLDTFRVMSIIGTPDKEVTIQNLSVENGFAKFVADVDAGHGGGIYANNSTGGKTIIDNVVFKNNTADRNGGGLLIEGLVAYGNTVTNCEFIENKALDITRGRGGAMVPTNTTITGSTFTGNECGDSGGAIFTGTSVAIYNSEFTGNSALDDSGGAIRFQGRDCYIRNSKLESNYANARGGAMFLARGDIYDCEFINNSSIEEGGAVFANNNPEIYNSVFIGNSTASNGGGVYADDDSSIQNSIFTDNTAGINGGGVYLKGAKAPTGLVGAIITNNAADSIGGGIYAAAGNIINSVITKNYAAENGGAISGDGGPWFLANSIVFDNDAAGADKNIQFISNSATDHAANSAIDVTAYDPGLWTASNITILEVSPFVGGSGADSLKLASGSALIDAGTTDFGVALLLPETDLNGVKRIINGVVDLGAYEHLQSFVVTTDADAGAGSLRQHIADAVDGESIITFADGITAIKVDQPLQLGDKSLIIDGGEDVILDGAFSGDVALDIHRVMTVTGLAEKELTIKNLTIQNGHAADGNGGGISADHSAGGKTMLDNVVFNDNVANGSGGALSLTGNSADHASTVTNSAFVGNSAGSDGGAVVAQNTVFTECVFSGNESGRHGGAARANAGALFEGCTFTGNIAVGAAGAIRLSNVTATASNCVFEDNSATDNAGAVFMARGSVLNSEFINNTSGGDGGAIYANQNECIIDHSQFHGNSAQGAGGAVFVDDGGVISNCIITHNTAVGNGGGVYLKGAIAPALTVGSVIANNTSSAQGGGAYVLSANVINTILTKNYAGTNGGAFTGETGPWFIANSVVWDNDAAEANKNIEVLSNSATDHAANSAIDATAYNAEAWTATDMIVLNESPFVGGLGADSLYSRPASGLIDAGTLEFGVADLLPETDLDGDFRIQGNIDMGAYETEVIKVLSVTLDRTSLQIGVGENRTLVPTVEPDHATDKSVTWSSSDESVATVEDGVVTGVADGSATITATTVDGGFTATCDVTVRTAVTGVELNEAAITLVVDGTFALEATILPANATNQTVFWVSDNEAVATVQEGVVTGISVGTATISVVTLDGSFIAVCEVTVNPATSLNAVNAANFNVYPNPVQDQLIIEGENIQSVTIYSITGAPVMIVEEGLSEGINVAALNSGMYFLEITTAKGTAVKTIIKK